MRFGKVLVILLALLCTRVFDVAVHGYASDAGDRPATATGEMLAETGKQDQPEPSKSLHAALHCACHTVASYQRQAWIPASPVQSRLQFPIVWATSGSSLTVSPPVPPPLA